MSGTGRPADQVAAHGAQGWGIHALIAGIWDPGRALPPAPPPLSTTRECGSCGEGIARRGTAWGVNWVGSAGNGLCRSAPNGVHWP